MIFCHPFEVAGSRVGGKTGHLDHFRFSNYFFFVMVVLCFHHVVFLQNSRFYFTRQRHFEWSQKVLKNFWIGWLVCFSFCDHFENTGGAEQLQAYSLIKFLMQQFFFVGIFFWLGTKRTQHQNIRVPGNNVRYLGVSVLMVFCVPH